MTEIEKEMASGECSVLYCVLSHISDDIREMHSVIDLIISDIEMLNNPNDEYVPILNDQELLFDLNRFRTQLNNFKTKFEGELI